MLSDIFTRLSPNILSEFLLYGASSERPAEEDIDQRLKDAEKEFTARLDAFALDPDLREELGDVFYEHQSVINLLYFEDGVKAGAALYRDLVGNKATKK